MTKPMSMIQRCGFAIWSVAPKRSGMTEADCKIYARAVISELMEPTEEMLDASVIGPVGGYRGLAIAKRENSAIFRAMLKAALE